MESPRPTTATEILSFGSNAREKVPLGYLTDHALQRQHPKLGDRPLPLPFGEREAKATFR